MKTKVVKYTLDSLPSATEKRRSQLKTLAARAEGEIDTGDIPSMSDEQYEAAKAAGQVFVGRFYRPLKKQITALVDADVLDWLKADGNGYQTRMNAILRREMTVALARRKAKPLTGRG